MRVVNLVTRGTIEERVLKTLASKQNLFAGVFEGDDDAIAFGAVNQSSFLDDLREILGEPKPELPVPLPPAVSSHPLVVMPEADGTAFWHAATALIDAVTKLVAAGKLREPEAGKLRLATESLSHALKPPGSLPPAT